MQRINNQFDKITLERRSLRSYDPSVKISREDMLQMLDEAFRRLLRLTYSLGVSSLSNLKKKKLS